MDTRSRELIATDKSTVIAKPILDAIMVEDSECNRRFSNASRADESTGLEVFSKADDLLNQFVASKTGPGWRGRGFSRRDATQT